MLFFMSHVWRLIYKKGQNSTVDEKTRDDIDHKNKEEIFIHTSHIMIMYFIYWHRCWIMKDFVFSLYYRMDILDTSHHICLICNQTVMGLFNYVEHFKSHATPQDSHLVEQKVDPFVTNDIKHDKETTRRRNEGIDNLISQGLTSPPSSSRQLVPVSQENSLFNADAFPLSGFSGDFPEPEIDTDDLLSPKNCPDFFQSLELKSITEEVRPKPKVKAVQRLAILEDDLHAESLLPITSILSIGNFDSSSDSEYGDENRDYHEDEGMEHSWHDDEDNTHSHHPPSSHTGGKWKPGQGPKRRMPIAGKVIPQMRPAPASRKRIMLQQSKGRGLKKSDSEKHFYCNICSEQFDNRITYTLHFSEKVHQAHIAEERQENNTSNAKAIVQSDDYHVEIKTSYPSQPRQESISLNTTATSTERLSSAFNVSQTTLEANDQSNMNDYLNPSLTHERLAQQQGTDKERQARQSYHCLVSELYMYIIF